MVTFTYIALLIGLAFGILQIILFFKLWRATNDIQKITQQQITLILILREFVDKYQKQTVKDQYVVSNVERQCVVEQPNIRSVESEQEIIVRGPLDALTDSEKAKLKEAIRNGKIQEARYMLMTKCGMSLSQADSIVKQSKTKLE